VTCLSISALYQKAHRGLETTLGTDIEVYGANVAGSMGRVQIDFCLDDGPPLTFNNTAPLLMSIPVGNFKLFSQAGLEQKKHTLNATLMNNGEFTLDYILVTPGVNAPNASETSTTDPSIKTSSSPSPGVIAGAVVGGVLGMLLVLGIFLFLQKRKARPQEDTIIAEPLKTDPCMFSLPRMV
jgi:hypothetical protein